ncbi:MAG TPA: ABC transporter ATP-binding protein [Candidatus Thermoplasmatota archaeon]|nr:ABC transporter ATP-binding protein [Candidatus Thermoplasmatota archaeon]
MTAAIELSGLTRRFGEFTAVDDLSLTVERGEILGFLGPNGAGKTTSIRLMTGLLAPTGGATRIYGRDIGKDPEAVRDHVGVCPQENVLWMNLTCEENLLFLAEMYGLPRGEAKARTADLLAKLGLTEKARTRAENLSGGMKRRLTIATALIHDPDIVVLDEPEAGLDPQARVVVRDFIRSLRGKKTVVLTTHNMDEAERLADRIAIVDRGRLIALDSAKRLKDTVGVGDVLEIKVGAVFAEPLAERLRLSAAGEVTVLEDTVLVRGLDLARRFPALLGEVEKGGFRVEDIRYRANTLEDVFIHLTGRGLRE